MAPIKMAEGVHWVGVLDPQLRVFDIIMKAGHGTTYNSYLVQGEKTAVIDTVKAPFFDVFMENIGSLVDPKDISYLVVNHTEPDHSGSLQRFLKEAPQAQIVCDRRCANFVKNIINRDAKPILVTQGDKLDLGGGTELTFIHAPFLHWPDTMFTYLEKGGILFPCDFLGEHYCDDRMFDDLVAEHEHTFEYYFQVIFRPFKKYVLEAIDKIKDLDIKMVAPSHGTLKRSDPWGYIEKYRQWASEPESQKKLLVFYVSAYGNTQMLAEAVADGARSSGIAASVMDATAVELGFILDEIEAAAGIAVGTATINGDALEPIWSLLSNLATLNVKGKIGATFGSYGWSGEGPKMVADRLKSLKFKVDEEPLRVVLVPTEEDLDQARDLGKRLARQIQGPAVASAAG
jgi:flavorubredoxin